MTGLVLVVFFNYPHNICFSFKSVSPAYFEYTLCHTPWGCFRSYSGLVDIARCEDADELEELEDIAKDGPKGAERPKREDEGGS